MADISKTEARSERRAAMLLIVTDGGLLMHHRDDKPGIANPGCWAGFGGAVEHGETVKEALLREVREETGLVITGVSRFRDMGDGCGPGACFRSSRVPGQRRQGGVCGPGDPSLTRYARAG